MRILFALPGFHRYDRGAEIALLSLASHLVTPDNHVTVIGSGAPRDNDPYSFHHAGSIRREYFERFPSVPFFRNETAYEELTFVPGLLTNYRPSQFDITVSCAFPFTNLMLRRPVLGGPRPRHVFVTQNGDWPAQTRRAEYRLFGCDGLVCTNPDFFDRNKDRWRCALIPNGLDTTRFRPGPDARERFGLPANKPVALMVSALIDTKRVADGIRAVAQVPDLHLVVAGDGPLRESVDALATEALPGRYTRLTVTPADMPDLYRSADVFLHMSLTESFGNVFTEALACGLPVVGHDTPRLRWIVGEDEFLVDTENPGKVASALIAATGAADHSERRSLKAQRFAWPTVAAQYRAFFQQVTED